jgi:restriction system protein
MSIITRLRHLVWEREECKKYIEEEKQREVAKWAEQNRIRSAARELQWSEADRLSKSIIPKLDDLYCLSPQRFENEVASLFVRLGYDVRQTPYSNDYGRDAILQKGGKKYVLQCKRYSKTNTVGRPDLQQFHGVIIDDKAVAGFFVTTGMFTSDAKEYAKQLGYIILIDGNELLLYLAQSKQSDLNSDRYWGMCLCCGIKVEHNIRSTEPVFCPNGHSVEPSLDISGLLGNSPTGRTPCCVLCGKRMRLINGKHGRFWGCSQYPQCRSTQRWVPL